MPESASIVAGVDVHKCVLMVVLGPPGQDEAGMIRRKFGTTRAALRDLAAWLTEQQVTAVVMESTAQYWWPVWLEREGAWTLFLAQARSNAAPHGRKTDYRDAARLGRRFHSGDLRFSFVPDAAQRLWRRLTRTWKSLGEQIVAVRNEMEALLEETQIKLSSFVSDLLGVSSRRLLTTLAEGETDRERLVTLIDGRLRVSRADLLDALEGHLTPVHRLVLRQHLAHIALLEQQRTALEQELQQQMTAHAEVLVRLSEVPGINLIAAQHLVAELGPTAAAFPSAG